MYLVRLTKDRRDVALVYLDRLNANLQYQGVLTFLLGWKSTSRKTGVDAH
jgi:hypothetical protein